MTDKYADQRPWDGPFKGEPSELNYETTDECDNCDTRTLGTVFHARGATGRVCEVLFLCHACEANSAFSIAEAASEQMDNIELHQHLMGGEVDPAWAQVNDDLAEDALTDQVEHDIRFTQELLDTPKL